jgi:hypothetical protein
VRLAESVTPAGCSPFTALGGGRPGYSWVMNTELHRPEAATTVPAKPTLDGIEDKWMQRWAKERVVQV